MRNESLFFSPKRVLYSAVMVSALLCGGDSEGTGHGPYWSTSYWCQCTRKGNFQRGNY